MNSEHPTGIDWSNVPDWIDVTEAVEKAGYHPDHIRRLLRAGKIKAEHKGNMWWVDRASLQAYVDRVDELGTKRFDPRGVMPEGNTSGE